MLHPCMHSKTLIDIENTESTHGEILYDYIAASTISFKTENNSTFHRPDRFVFTRKFL